MKSVWGVGGLVAALVALSAFAFSSTKTVTVTRKVVAPSRVETIYILNRARRYISNKEISYDIPAWEKAANKQFAPVWHTPQVHLVLARSAPPGALVAEFKKDGPIQGALAFHTVARGKPAIIVYAGTDDYFGYSNSVSFTHELFEFLADPSISITNQGWPYPYFYVGTHAFTQAPGTVWANEVCDAVEAYGYRLDGVTISDFITPNWFNDHVNGGYDYMGVVQQPFEITRGGYSQFWNGTAWTVIVNFRHAGPDAAGFLKGERASRH